MLHILSPLIILLISVIFINNSTLVLAEKTNENFQSKWTRYTNQTYGFTLEYPSAWEVKEYQQNTKNEIFDLQIGPLTKNILNNNFTGFFAFKSFGESAFGKIPIDDMNIITDIVKNTVEKIITNNYNLHLTTINVTQIHKLTDTNKEIGTFAFLGKQDQKNTIIMTIVANHNGKTMAFFILGTLNQFENPKLVERVIHILNSIKWIESDSTYTSDYNPNRDPLDPEMFLNKLLNPTIANASALGNEQAKITIVEFADYQCPFCAQFHRETMHSLKKNFIDTEKVKFLFKDLIVNDRQYDKASTLAASASYCAAEQGMYWEYHDELFKNSKGENTGWVTKNSLMQFANNVRVPDLMKFSDCIDSDKYNEIVSENDSFARNIGLQSTPSFIFYNGTTPVAIQGVQPYEAFEQIITAIE